MAASRFWALLVVGLLVVLDLDWSRHTQAGQLLGPFVRRSQWGVGRLLFCCSALSRIACYVFSIWGAVNLL